MCCGWIHRLGSNRSDKGHPRDKAGLRAKFYPAAHLYFGAGKIRYLSWNKTIKHGIQSRTNNHPLTAFGHCPVGTYGMASHVLMKKLTENQNLRGFGPTAYVSLELAVEHFCRLLGSGVARHQPFANSIAMWMSCVTGEKSMTSHHQCAMDFQNGLPNIFSLSVNLTFCVEATSFLSNRSTQHALVFSGHHRT